MTLHIPRGCERVYYGLEASRRAGQAGFSSRSQMARKARRGDRPGFLPWLGVVRWVFRQADRAFWGLDLLLMPKEGNPGYLVCLSRCGTQGKEGRHVQTGVLLLLYSPQQVSLPWTFRGLGTSTLLEVHTKGNDAESKCSRQEHPPGPLLGTPQVLSTHTLCTWRWMSCPSPPPLLGLGDPGLRPCSSSQWIWLI